MTKQEIRERLGRRTVLDVVLAVHQNKSGHAEGDPAAHRADAELLVEFLKAWEPSRSVEDGQFDEAVRALIRAALNERAWCDTYDTPPAHQLSPKGSVPGLAVPPSAFAPGAASGAESGGAPAPVPEAPPDLTGYKFIGPHRVQCDDRGAAPMYRAQVWAPTQEVLLELAGTPEEAVEKIRAAALAHKAFWAAPPAVRFAAHVRKARDRHGFDTRDLIDCIEILGAAVVPGLK